MSIDNIPPGALVLCGEATTAQTDVAMGNYGVVANEGSAAESGNCVVTSTIQIKNPSDHVTAWATVYTGSGGATVGSWSMNELPVGQVIVSH
jgi:hypothetical protein